MPPLSASDFTRDTSNDARQEWSPPAIDMFEQLPAQLQGTIEGDGQDVLRPDYSRRSLRSSRESALRGARHTFEDESLGRFVPTLPPR